MVALPFAPGVPAGGGLQLSSGPTTSTAESAVTAGGSGTGSFTLGGGNKPPYVAIMALIIAGAVAYKVFR